LYGMRALRGHAMTKRLIMAQGSAFLFALTPRVARIWSRQSRAGREPGSVEQMGLGFLPASIASSDTNGVTV
jgi:hypothetical protein